MHSAGSMPYLTACRFQSAEQLAESREETIEYFAAQYRKMLEENLGDHIAQFDKYMKPGQRGTTGSALQK